MKKRKDQGFTLVELIIVVAVIAILAGVLAPQYLQYVERSRESNDLQIATSIIDAALIAIADPANQVPANETIEVLWGTAYPEEHEYHSWLLVREAGNSSDRISAIFPTKIAASNFDTTKLAEGIIEIMGEEVKNNHTDKYCVLDSPQSSVASTTNFVIHINTSSGEVAVAYVNGQATPNAWIDEIGMNIISAP